MATGCTAAGVQVCVNKQICKQVSAGLLQTKSLLYSTDNLQLTSIIALWVQTHERSLGWPVFLAWIVLPAGLQESWSHAGPALCVP